MRIGRIRVDNFKSLVGFDLRLAKFTCLIGLNGAGKSTALQFLDFMGRQVDGDLSGWLRDREWELEDVRSRLSPSPSIDFRIDFSAEDGELIGHWNVGYDPVNQICRSEYIQFPDAKLNVDMEEYSISSRDEGVWSEVTEPITFRYQGSILSQLRADRLPESLTKFKSFIQSIHSLDLLSPELLRSRTREAGGTLGLGGKKLSAFLHEMDTAALFQLGKELQQVYPQIVELEPKGLRSGWKQLDVRETFPAASPIVTPSRHLNDGMLRLIAVLAELLTDHDVALFDEIENGVNPELIEFLLGKLTAARQQIVVTTHSPLILNYLDDETARDGVMYLYRSPRGATRAIPFFAIPSVAEKLTVMGPGEAFVDTNLSQLADEIASLSVTEI